MGEVSLQINCLSNWSKKENKKKVRLYLKTVPSALHCKIAFLQRFLAMIASAEIRNRNFAQPTMMNKEMQLSAHITKERQKKKKKGKKLGGHGLKKGTITF